MRDINLLPENRRKITDKHKKYIYLILFTIFFLVLSFAVIFFLDKAVEKDIAKIQSQIAQLEESFKIRESLEFLEQDVVDNLNLLDVVEKKNYDYRKLISDIKDAAPKGTVFLDLKIHGGNIQISGYINSEKKLSTFLNNLQIIDDIESTWLNSTQFDDVVYFDISCKYKYLGGTTDELE